MVTTDEGEVAVEKLLPGMMVMTRDNGFQPLRWVGLRKMTGRFLLDHPHLRPVLIQAGAFDAAMPGRDTMVTPNCRVPVAAPATRFLGREKEQMMAVKTLIDHRTIQQIDTLGVTYVHLMFRQHEIISANGFWVECFKAGDYSLNAIGNSQRNELFEIFPELRASQARHEARETSLKSRLLGRFTHA